jgi:hypothetical protein
MSAISYSAWLLCVLGGVVFAGCSAKTTPSLLAFSLSLTAGLAAGPFLDSSFWGLAAFTLAAALLHRRERRYLASIGAGLACAGIGVVWSAFAPSWIGAAGGVALCAMAGMAAGRPGFATERVREEALFLLAALGLFSAALPGVAAGWHSAIALNVAIAGSQGIPVWVLSLGGIAIASGGVYNLWRRAH